MIRLRSENEIYSYLVKFNQDSEYVPLFALGLPSMKDNENFIKYPNYYAEEVKSHHEFFQKSPLSKFTEHSSIFNRYNAHELRHSKNLVDTYLGKMEYYLSEGLNIDGLLKRQTTWLYKKDMIRHISGEYTDLYNCSVSGNYYWLGNMFASKTLERERWSKKIIPLFSLMVKREHIEYVKLCWILGKQPIGDIFEFWMDKGFDTKETKDNYLRTYVYRKHIKPILKEKNIPIIEKDNMLDDIFRIIRQPKVKTLQERKDWLNMMSDEFTQFLNPYVEVPEEELPMEGQLVYGHNPGSSRIVWSHPTNRVINTGEGIMSQIQSSQISMSEWVNHMQNTGIQFVDSLEHNRREYDNALAGLNQIIDRDTNELTHSDEFIDEFPF